MHVYSGSLFLILEAEGAIQNDHRSRRGLSLAGTARVVGVSASSDAMAVWRERRNSAAAEVTATDHHPNPRHFPLARRHRDLNRRGRISIFQGKGEGRPPPPRHTSMTALGPIRSWALAGSIRSPPRTNASTCARWRGQPRPSMNLSCLR